MANKQTSNYSRRQAQGDDDTFNPVEILNKFLSHWLLFLVFLTLFIALAFIYTRIVKPDHQIQATMLMHDDSKDKATEEKSALQELDLVTPAKNIENEVEVLQSRSLIKSVIENLQLWITYRYKDGLIINDLYNETPLKLIMFNKPALGLNKKLNVKIINAQSFMLVADSNSNNKYLFRDTVANDMGKWKLSPTGSIDKYIGKTIQILVSDLESTTVNYQSALDVSVKDKLASVVELTVIDKNIKRGEDFLNTLIYFYNQAETAEKNNITKSTLKFIDKRLDSLSRELNHAEGSVAGYRSSRGLTDVNAQSQVYLQNGQANDTRLNEINIQLKVIDGLDNYVNSGNDNQSTPSTIGIADPTLLSLVQKLSDLQLEKTKLLATLPERNPAFDPINKQISTVKSALVENIKSIKTTLLTTRQQLQSYKSNNQASISSMPGQERQLGGLERQQTVKESLYTYLLQKREQISLSYASSLSNARLLDVAYAVPLKASKKYIPFAIAVFMGLFIPIGIIFGKEAIRNTVTKRREIVLATSLPVLAEISYLKLKSDIVTAAENKKQSFALIEQFRHLRTQLNLLHPDIGQGRVTLITSSITSEGKSFISSNLAISLAKSGKKTLLLELDNYKPKVSNIFGVTVSPGLSDFLKGKASAQEVIKPLPDYPNLNLISTGEYIDDFSELIEQSPFHDLINGFKEYYDHILIDCPPIHSINDANIVARLADTTLYVVRFDYTSKSLLPFISKLNAEEMLPSIQVIFNGLTKGRDGEGYKYEQYYQKKDAV